MINNLKSYMSHRLTRLAKISSMKDKRGKILDIVIICDQFRNFWKILLLNFLFITCMYIVNDL